MAVIFIDGGCYNGDTIRSAIDYRPMMAYKVDTYLGYDISHRFDKAWQTIKADNSKLDIQFFKKALWVHDDGLQVSIMPEGAEYGNTAHKDKDKYGKGEFHNVESIDFSEELKKYKDDTVIVKLDIEGAEFPILEKMIKDGTDSIPEFMMIEFHHKKMHNKTMEDTQALIDKLKCKVFVWR